MSFGPGDHSAGHDAAAEAFLRQLLLLPRPLPSALGSCRGLGVDLVTIQHVGDDQGVALPPGPLRLVDQGIRQGHRLGHLIGTDGPALGDRVGQLLVGQAEGYRALPDRPSRRPSARYQASRAMRRSKSRPDSSAHT